MITLWTYTEITFSILLVFEIIFQNTKFQEIKLKNVLISRNIISYIHMFQPQRSPFLLSLTTVGFNTSLCEVWHISGI